MYSRDTWVRERDTKMGFSSVGGRKGPSFSSTLLDEIYRSIDDGSARENRSTERARVVGKWMERRNKKQSGGNSPVKMELNNTPKKLHYVDNDPLFFSSGSNSSDSNSSLFSEHESIPNPNPLPTTKARSSCFLPPKPIRTGAKTEREEEEVPPSTTSRALKLYAHLKKMKQPISPGMKLTAFINSLLSNSKPKRGTAASTKPMTTCSSASSFTRSSKSVKIEEEPIRTRTLKLQLNRDELRHHDQSLKPSSKIEINRKAAESRAEAEDNASDCSEDLFEIDHLKVVRFTTSAGGELPVYETTTTTTRVSLSSNQSQSGVRNSDRQSRKRI